MNTVHFFGAIKVTLDESTGRVLAVQDRISGEAASLHFLPAYITAAEHAAKMAWEAITDECV